MAGESFAIIAVIFVMDVMLLRAGKKAICLLSLPLLGVPLFCLMGMGIGAIIPLPAEMLYPGMVVAGALVGIAGCVVLTLFLKGRAPKIGYLTLSVIYLVALAIAYLMKL